MRQATAVRDDQALAVVVSTQEVLGHPAARRNVLTSVELRRAAAFRFDRDRDDFVAAHLLVRLCAGRLLGVPADTLSLVQHCADCGSREHGKPSLAGLPDVHVSLSHTQGVVAAAVGRQRVGVDVERATVPDTVLVAAERVLSDVELRTMRASALPDRYFLRQWVRKESLVKIGETRLGDMAKTDLSALPVDTPDGSPCLSRHGELYVLDWTDDRRDAVAAVVSAGRPRLGVAETPLSDITD
ncbi:4'-phosphopantetheinyl transferase family protein [Streptomyces sp. S.PNR 29]|uniref:4'-phosphopantetheinyl transferase family protein n=1 Tax=Streptomyces sp. S.PNR 29 TaxID=2973805 RepID=UPI0025AF7725|nr:4'-phosphopantetheinyl transferase family protein [Streptomyces sp. S.PNR 29]MDN0196788.1 4'-phosphopantetheinyl transferase superfamily protein [Streptomyces sp. S.PNR 29]